ncbi:hypothetical protein ACF0H5_019228 [Mactra antiquata]
METTADNNLTVVHASKVECKNRGGHLAYITNQGEQDYVQSFTSQYKLEWGVWIGLNDVNQKGHLQWSSGYPVSFTNFALHHIGNEASTIYEDCIAFFSPSEMASGMTILVEAEICSGWILGMLSIHYVNLVRYPD